jgi:hypothetical protein
VCIRCVAHLSLDSYCVHPSTRWFILGESGYIEYVLVSATRPDTRQILCHLRFRTDSQRIHWSDNTHRRRVGDTCRRSRVCRIDRVRCAVCLVYLSVCGVPFVRRVRSVSPFVLFRFSELDVRYWPHLHALVQPRHRLLSHHTASHRRMGTTRQDTTRRDGTGRDGTQPAVATCAHAHTCVHQSHVYRSMVVSVAVTVDPSTHTSRRISPLYLCGCQCSLIDPSGVRNRDRCMQALNDVR